MNSAAKLSFAILPLDGVHSVTPCVNGESLIEIVSRFERDRGFSPAGGYGPLIPAWFDYGPIDRYFAAEFERDSHFFDLRGIYILGCSCGEVGCWPLFAQVSTTTETISWSGFRQPFRPEWRYTEFGPFVFKHEEYKQTVAALRDELSSLIE